MSCSLKALTKLRTTPRLSSDMTTLSFQRDHFDGLVRRLNHHASRLKRLNRTLPLSAGTRPRPCWVVLTPCPILVTGTSIEGERGDRKAREPSRSPPQSSRSRRHGETGRRPVCCCAAPVVVSLSRGQTPTGRRLRARTRKPDIGRSSTRSGVVDSSDISLCPLLGKPFGGCAGFIDVEVLRGTRAQALYIEVDGGEADLNFTAASNGTPFLRNHEKDDSVSEVKNLP